LSDFIQEAANIWRRRDLVWNLALKGFKVRYKSSALALLWAVLNPLLMMFIFVAVFSYVVRLKIPNYPLFLLIALIPWQYLSHCVSLSPTVVISNSVLIKKVMFPRESLPLSLVVEHGLSFLISLCLLIIFLIAYRIRPTGWAALFIPLALVQVMFITGLSLLLSSLNVLYRDVQQLTEVVLLLWFYATPIFYPISMVPEKFQGWYLINPMAALTVSYRDVLLYAKPPDLFVVGQTVLISLAAFVIGWAVFRRISPVMADMV